LELARAVRALGPAVERPLSDVDRRLHVLFAGVLDNQLRPGTWIARKLTFL
jgi:hypothetical protein